MQYVIRAKYYYYSNTLSPRNRNLRNQWDQVIVFESFKEAEDYLTDPGVETPFGVMSGFNCEKNADNTYSLPGTYVTNYGEYARPSYKIIKYKSK